MGDLDESEFSEIEKKKKKKKKKKRKRSSILMGIITGNKVEENNEIEFGEGSPPISPERRNLMKITGPVAPNANINEINIKRKSFSVTSGYSSTEDTSTSTSDTTS